MEFRTVHLEGWQLLEWCSRPPTPVPPPLGWGRRDRDSPVSVVFGAQATVSVPRQVAEVPCETLFVWHGAFSLAVGSSSLHVPNTLRESLVRPHPFNQLAREGFYCLRLSTWRDAASFLKESGPERWSNKRKQSWRARRHAWGTAEWRWRSAHTQSQALLHRSWHFLRQMCSKHFLQTRISWCKNIQEIPQDKVKINLRRDLHKHQDAGYIWEKKEELLGEAAFYLLATLVRTFALQQLILNYTSFSVFLCSCFLFLSNSCFKKWILRKIKVTITGQS